MKRGTVVWIDLSDASPPEMGKRRPAVVVSSDMFNATLGTAVVLPLSSRPPEILPLRVRVGLSKSKQPSFAVVPGIRQIKLTRVLGTVGDLSVADLDRVDEAIRGYLFN